MPSQPLFLSNEREIIRDSILKNRLHLWQLQCDLNETISISQKTVLESRELIAEVDDALARR